MDERERGARVTHAYYLRSSEQGEGVALLTRSGVGGYVWPPAKGWVPIVTRGWARCRPLLESLRETDLLLRYAVVEGGGWSFELLSKGKCFVRYAESDAGRAGELVEENLPLLERLVLERGALGTLSEAASALRSVLSPGKTPTPLSRLASTAPHRVFAALLGLSPAEGLFYDDLPSDLTRRGEGVLRVSPRSARSAPHSP